MTQHARGPFEVKLTPQALALEHAAGGARLGRMAIEKQYRGELEASASGEMLSAMAPVQGSAGYVAIEKGSGTLGGRSGTFVLQHDATMTRGKPYLHVIVVPDSGTGELEGLSGSMNIVIEKDGAHFYELDYALPPS